MTDPQFKLHDHVRRDGLYAVVIGRTFVSRRYTIRYASGVVEHGVPECALRRIEGTHRTIDWEKDR